MGREGGGDEHIFVIKIKALDIVIMWSKEGGGAHFLEFQAVGGGGRG